MQNTSNIKNIEPIYQVATLISNFVKENQLETKLTDPTSDKIYLLLIVELTDILSKLIETTPTFGADNDSLEIMYQYLCDNFDYYGLCIKQLALNLSGFLETNEDQKLYPLYLELTKLGQQAIDSSITLNSDQPFIIAYK